MKEDASYQVKANEFVFTLTDNEIAQLDFIQKSPDEFHIIKNYHSVSALVLAVDDSAKKIKIEIEGETFDIQIKDSLDQMLDIMGFGKLSTKHIKEIKAPMPGLVLEISVTEGQQVNEGDKILILEAMKMENSIIIQTSATIKKINVIAGQAVDKGQVLVELD